MVSTPTPSERLAALRAAIAAQELAGFLVPRGDEHLGEYVPPSGERLAWLTGFSGSAGLAAVLTEQAAVWSDGRYVLQLASQTDEVLWDRLHLTETPPAPWIAARIGTGTLGYDPWLHSEEGLKPFRDAGIALQAVASNPVDACWADRPAPPSGPAVPHDVAFAGATSAEKRAQIAEVLRAAGQDAAVIGDPASIAWLLNIRGSDVEGTPFALGFCLVHADGAVDLFMDGGKLPAETRVWLGNGVSLAERASLPDALARLAGRRVRVDPAGAAAWFGERLREAGAVVLAGADPCLVPKARKNPVEQQGARAAHGRDAAALSRFLHWVGGAGGQETELSVSERLLDFRAAAEHFRGASFSSIAGAGEHGAIIHYHATPESNRTLHHNEVFLIDSGGQYLDGTTDVTRTIWTGPDEAPPAVKDRFTRVLKGHIALATAVFPEGTAGVRLDAFARAALWQAGLDYDHGTGHGVGSYLSVHEGPASISPHLRAAGIAEGMILSNEPGFYLPGAYGIRIENLMLAHRADVDSEKPFLRFETLTLAPIDQALIEPTLLRQDEIDWVNEYHARVLREVGPRVPAETAAWLVEACAPLKVTECIPT
jgi:Xaa-Pro aminopeptidase